MAKFSFHSESNIKLLLVEDEKSLAKYLQISLQDEAGNIFDVKNASYLSEAMAFAGQENFDVVLLDLNLPDSNGMDTLIKFRERFPDIAVVILTGMEDKEFYKEYVENPIPWITLDKGPWLKPTVAGTSTSLDTKIISNIQDEYGNTKVTLKIENIGKIPAFMTKIDIEGAKRIFYASDNYFWMNPGEEKIVDVTLKFREDFTTKKITLNISAWNSDIHTIDL